MEAGFGCADISAIFFTRRRVADALEVRALAVRGSGGLCVLASADLCILWPSICLDIRKRIASAIGTAPANVGIFVTQNHGVPYNDPPKVLDVEKLSAAYLKAAKEAVARLERVEVARVAARPAPALNLGRRVPFGDLGAFCFWFGYRVTAHKADATHLIKQALNSLRRGEPYQFRCQDLTGSAKDFDVPAPPEPVPAACPFPPPPDDLAQGLFFRAPGGKPVGALLRFATHPATSKRPGCDYYSGDYPAYARLRSEARFGGSALFLTGPCGDSCPLTGQKSLEFSRANGEAITDTLLAALSGAAWEASGPVAALAPEVELRTREDCPRTLAEGLAKAQAAAARLKKRAAEGAPLAELKHLSDLYELNHYAGTGAFREWTGLEVARIAGSSVKHPLYMLRIGSSVIAGLPGEPFGAYSARLRDETLSERLLVLEEANGYLSYLPNAADFPFGSYEVNAAIFAPDSEARLIDAVKLRLPEFAR